MSNSPIASDPSLHGVTHQDFSSADLNWRYLLGKTLSSWGNGVLASPYLPLLRAVPRGLSYPYDIKRMIPGESVHTILDVGANIGQTSLFLQRHFPAANCWAFEPFTPAFQSLQNNTKRFSRIHPQHYALGAECKTLERPIRQNSELNTLVESSHRSDEVTLGLDKIDVQTLDDFLEGQQIEIVDLLKMDVQGYELEVLKGAEQALKQKRIRFVYSEISFELDNPECACFEVINRYLEKYGFLFSGFYEVFRWGPQKQYFGFCNALFVQKQMI